MRTNSTQAGDVDPFFGTGGAEAAALSENAKITPLRKRRPNGELYARYPKVEALLVELSALSRDDLTARAMISKREDPSYIPSECLVYFIRASRSDNGETWFEQIYKILARRVLRSLPKGESADGKTESFTRGVIREMVFGRFGELLAIDRTTYSESLDYFEVRFEGALASLRRDAQEKAWRDENRSTPLEYDEETGELSPEVEQAAGHSNPLAEPEIDGEAYRLRLGAAIETLPPEQSRIIEMLRQGFPIDSKEPGAMTIAKALGRSEKTIRTYRDKAFATLRAILVDGDER